MLGENMKLFYCPECGKEEIKNNNPSRSEVTFMNLRDGYGRPITHYKCECGNLLAGSMDVTGWEDDQGLIIYTKETIKGYNRGGCYYSDGLYERIEKRYKENTMKRGLR